MIECTGTLERAQSRAHYMIPIRASRLTNQSVLANTHITPRLPHPSSPPLCSDNTQLCHHPAVPSPTINHPSSLLFPTFDMPLSSPAPVRRRARRPHPPFIPRNPFRYARRRRRSALSSGPFSSDLHPVQNPIYIYPGLLRGVRDNAIALDNQCPAVLYKCRECRRERISERPPTCPHQTACAICLDEFHGKDLVRKLPCNINHVFHSKCILDWFVLHHRCPLCNESITNSLKPLVFTHSLDYPCPPLQIHPPLSYEASFPRLRRMHAYRTAPRASVLTPPTDPIIPREEITPLEASSLRGLHPAPLPTVPVLHNNSCQHSSESTQKLSVSEKPKKKNRVPRTYSYIVHDNVRMEMNPIVPV